MIHSKRFLALITVAILASMSLLLYRTTILPCLLGSFLVVHDSLQPADVLHVIAGDDYRTDYAIQLYKEGFSKVIFFTGGWCALHHYYHGRHAKERALAQGVPLEAIAVDESPVTSTYSEALRLKAYIAQSHNPIRSVIVVSDPFHMRRVRWTYQHVLDDEIKVQMAPVPFETSRYQQHWWEDDESRLMVKEELLKLLYYYIRYGLGWTPLSKWLAAFDVE